MTDAKRGVRVHENRAAAEAAADPVWTAGNAEAARRTIRDWSDYAPTPLRELPGLAERLGIAALHHKDEGPRFGLGSFKALGGAYGVARALADEIRRRTGIAVEADQLRDPAHADIVTEFTVACASEGNHGRSVAWGAARVGCRAVVYLPGEVSRARESAIAAFGADTVRVDGGYDATVRHCAAESERLGHTVVSDTAYPGYSAIPQYIMQGYTLLMAEVLERLDGARPTHVLAQAGVGGLAGAVCAHLHEAWGTPRPALVVVEPHGADCFYRSARAGRSVTVDVEGTIMKGLACGAPSTVAWRILRRAEHFITIPDSAAVRAMRTLAEGAGGDPPVVVGESGAAGVGALLALADDGSARDALGLGPDARVLTIGTEGATDPELYRRHVGRSAEAVRAAGPA